MKRKCIYGAFFLLASLTFGFFSPNETVQIRIFAHLRVNSAKVQAAKGVYRLIADNQMIAVMSPTVWFDCFSRNDSVEVMVNGVIVGRYRFIKMVAEVDGELKIKLTDPEKPVRTYQDHVSFAVMEGALRIVNDIVLDKYIGGVTEAEAGSRTFYEFYKVQAILARTFALAHINKHATEGFCLCDQVHCQAYFGKPRDLSISKAVDETKGMVVVDDNLNLIIAAFHSNSGGQTANSEDVWGKATPYLRSINDTFSLGMPNSKWTRRMLKDDWLTYLKLKHNFPVDKEEGKRIATNFYQNERKVYLESGGVKVPLKIIRQDFLLKSTYFNVVPLGKDSILISGRGYGHGLGMCQEGAMRMAKLGYSYTEILKFYYKNIQLINLQKLSFYKDE